MSQTAAYILDTQIQRRTVVTESLSAQEDGRLMQAFMAGDDDAFSALFDRHNERLYLYSARLLGNSTSAEDVIQEVWERVIRLRAEPQEIHNPAGFLLTIARNLSLNLLKKKKRQRLLEQEVKRESLQEVRVGSDDLKDIVIEGLNSLPMKYREVLVLNLYSGYNFDEIAEMLEISTDAAWKRASRGRKELRDILLRHSSVEKVNTSNS